MPIWIWFVLGGVVLFSALGATIYVTYKNKEETKAIAERQKSRRPKNLNTSSFGPGKPEKKDIKKPAEGADLEDIVNYVEFGVVKVEVSDEWNNRTSLGTGFVVDPAGLIVTNYHVTDAAVKADALFSDGTRYGIEGYVALAPESDLVLLKLNGIPPNMQVLDLNTDEPRKASKVFALGHPHGYDFLVTQGIVSRVVKTSELPEDAKQFLKYLGDKVDNTWISHDASIAGGNSGGPLCNGRGEVIGVNTWGNEGTHINYAVSAQHVRNLLQNQFPSIEPLKKHRKPQPTLAQMVGSDLDVTADKIKELTEKMVAKNWRPESDDDWQAMSDLMLQLTIASRAAADKAKSDKADDGKDADKDEGADKDAESGAEKEDADKDDSKKGDGKPGSKKKKKAFDDEEEDEGEGDGDDSGEEEEEVDQATIDQANATLKIIAELAWDPEKQIKPINKWADEQVHKPLKGVLLFGTVKKFFTSNADDDENDGRTRNGILLELNDKKTVFIPVEDKTVKYEEGHKLSVVAITLGIVLRHGENPLDPEESPIVIPSKFFDVSF